MVRGMALDLTELKAALAENALTVLTAPPGTGKTTQIPPALLDAPWLQGRKILVLEPRRLAARRAATYIAERLGEAPGRTVGWQVRLERCVSAGTRIEFLTEGLLARRILADPELADVGAILFDEFHERALALDVSFALAREVRESLRPDLRLLVMSATLQPGLLAEARFISVPAVAYPVDIRYLGAVSPTSAILKALREEAGSVLCFLPGEGEIKRVCRELTEAGLPSGVRVAPLYAALSRQEQDTAVMPSPSGERKVVLATSIAESSITIEDVRVVIDTGLARVPKYVPRNGLTRLVTQRIPQDRMAQRTGRAGRVAPGVCYRLWAERETALLPKVSQPEILDADLTQTALLCAEWGARELAWLTPPPPSAWRRAWAELQALGAVEDAGRLTALGREMARFPVHPALAAMMLRMQKVDRAGGALLAAICAEGERLTALREMQDFRRVIDRVLQERPREVWRLAERWAGGEPRPRLTADALAPYILWAFPGHLARRRDRSSGRYLLAAGFGAVLPEGSPLVNAEWLAVARMGDAEAEAVIRWAVPLAPEAVELCRKRVETRIEWDKSAGKLVAAEEERIGALVLKQRPLASIPPEMRQEAERCRLRHEGLPWTRADRALAARLAFLNRALPEEQWQAVSEEDLIEKLSAFPGMSVGEAIRVAVREAGHTMREVDEAAPPVFEVPSGSRITIHYAEGQPHIAVKIQEVFGLGQTPRLAKGRVPLLFHLLSPANRPVQITADLASFWAGGYQEVRKDLRGRYPKHYWPEDPTQAIATRRTVKSKMAEK